MGSLFSKGNWADQILHCIDRAKADGYVVIFTKSSDEEWSELSIYDSHDSSFGVVIYDEGDE